MSFGPATTLENEFVRLEPLSDSHTGDLTEAVKEGELWRAWHTSLPAPDSMADAVRSRLAAGERGEIVPWTIIDVTSGRAIGMSSYLHLEPANRRLEIGSTWIGRAHPEVEPVAGKDADSASPRMVRITVRDTGPGIAPEALEHVLERFYRTPDAEKVHTPGTGLGLAIAHELAQANGGRIEIHSPDRDGVIATLVAPAVTAESNEIPPHGV